MPNGIPGFDEAAAQESRERNGAYLNLPSVVCGVSLRQMTPLDLSRLNYARNAFIVGGAVNEQQVAQFLFLLRSEVEENEKLARKRQSKIFENICELTIEHAHGAIKEYLDVTFRDGNEGGASTEDAPIATSTAWLEYRMGFPPWNWDRDRTVNMPLRIIFAQIRCWKKEQGTIVTNALSGKKSEDFLASINRLMAAGEITQADIDKMNEISRNAGGRN